MRCTSLLIVLFLTFMVFATEAATIQDGIAYPPTHFLAGRLVKLGFDIYGYNYQDHIFCGTYFNKLAGYYGFPPYKGNDEKDAKKYETANPAVLHVSEWQHCNDQLLQIWNDAWMSNQDRDGKAFFDFHWGYANYQGSGAWQITYWSGFDEVTVKGKTKKVHWFYYEKLVAVPMDAKISGNIWCYADGRKIGPQVGPYYWDCAITQQFYWRDPS